MQQRVQKSVSSPITQTRAAVSIPDKVFIEREVGQYEYSTAEPPGLERFYKLLDGYYGASNFMELFYCLPEVYSAVHQIASRVADAVWELRRDSTDEPIFTDADFNRLFTKPNPLMSMKQLVYQAVCYEILTGREFWTMNKPETLGNDYKSVLSWYNLPAHQVRVDQKKIDPYSATEITDFVNKYSIPGHNGGTRNFEPREVMPLVNFALNKSFDMNSCRSYLLGAEKAIKNLIPVYEARGVLYIKRGALGFIVSRKTDDSGTVNLTKTEKLELENDYQKTYGLTDGRQTVGITGMPVDFIRTGMSIEELQPFDETLADAVAIYATLKIPRHLVPSKDTSTFANAEADIKAFYEDVIIPWAKKYAEIWTDGFGFSFYKKSVYPNFNHINILQADKKKEADTAKVATEVAVLKYEKGIITKNQRNAAVGEKSVTDGDTYATDDNNKDPLATRLGVGGLQALKEVLTDTTLSEEAKKNTLVVVFGINENDASKLVIPKEETDETIQKPVKGAPPVAQA